MPKKKLPTLEITDSVGRISEYAHQEVWAHMFFPKDEEKAMILSEHLKNIAAYDYTVDCDDINNNNVLLSLDLAKSYRESMYNIASERDLLLKKYTNGMHASCIAITFFTSIQTRIIAGENLKYTASNQVSLNNIYSLLAKNDALPGEKTLKKIWQEYTPVSHLWAACDILDVKGFKPGDNINGIRYEELFLMYAKTIMSMFMKYTPHGYNSTSYGKEYLERADFIWVNDNVDMLIEEIPMPSCLKSIEEAQKYVNSMK